MRLLIVRRQWLQKFRQDGVNLLRLAVWQVGGHVTYHHDMFQTGYNSTAVPPHGIPDPEFSAYHRQVFEFLALRGKYLSHPKSRDGA